MNAVQGRGELFLIRRRAGDVVRRRGIVVNLAQGDAMSSPAALERARVHVVHQNALIQEAVGDIDLVSILVEIKGTNAGREDISLLIVLLHFVGRHFGTAVPEIPEKLSVAVKLDDAVAGRGAGDPDVPLPVDAKSLQSARPTRHVVGTAPGI